MVTIPQNATSTHLCFWYKQNGQNHDRDGGRPKDEADVCAEVAVVWADHKGASADHRQTHDPTRTARDGQSLGPESGGQDFHRQCVARRTPGERVGELEKRYEGDDAFARGRIRRGRLGDDCKGQHTECLSTSSADHDRSPPAVFNQRPGAHRPRDRAHVGDHGGQKRIVDPDQGEEVRQEPKMSLATDRG